MNPTTLLPAAAFPHPWPWWRTPLAGAVHLPTAHQQQAGGWRWGLVGAVGKTARHPFGNTDR